jgi:nicotinate-nucleotide pyrophosphorylase (carboxylating)
MPELPDNIKESVQISLHEDVGDGDKTASLLRPAIDKAEVICRENAILCGTAWFNEVFSQLDANIRVHWFKADGDQILANDILCELEGQTGSLLTGERTALNFLQTLSATATQTSHYVNAVKHTACRILDTRKTIPGLRLAQKYAVLCGGGINHRIGLYDAILIKENHIAAAGSIRKAISKAREDFPGIFVEVEVENSDEFEQAIDAEPDRILLDNFTVAELSSIVAFNCGCNQLEASGNITLENIAAVAETGVDFISTGSITKNIQAIDLSMRILSP